MSDIKIFYNSNVVIVKMEANPNLRILERICNITLVISYPFVAWSRGTNRLDDWKKLFSLLV